MLKYLYAKEIFKEIPNELTLGISISGCQIRCKECHSKELWEDVGIPLTIEELQRLLNKHRGITCVCFLGGEHNISHLIGLLHFLWGKVETAWYCGLNKLPDCYSIVFKYLNYIKLGRYIAKKGGLDNPNTNQKLYHVIHYGHKIDLEDITYKLQKKNNQNNRNNEN